MIAPLSWLKEYVDIDASAEELQEKLFSCGFEVEELTYLGKDVVNVVTGKIISCERHPDADRLTVCKVDCGAHGEKQIVTAATNVFAGATVPVALDGSTVLHEGGVQKIKTGKLRGVPSEGMFCSGEELGINDDFYAGAEVNGILILDDGTPVGKDIRPVVGIDDWLFDIAITANRPDCMSVYGMAREVAAVLKKPLKPLETDFTEVKTDVKIPVTVLEPTLCPRYIGHFVTDVKIGVSPRAIRRRLALCGVRSVSDVVDITNYVLLEVGQPMHAFDRSFLRGGEIIVRRAGEGEKIVTLDEKEFTLTGDNLLIADKEGGVALAGIMGGLNSEIKPDTKEVFFEAAKFARDSVRKTARALGQHTDSSALFEKGVNEYTTEKAICRALNLITKLECGTVTDLHTDVKTQYSNLTEKKMCVSIDKINALLGICVPTEKMVKILKNINFGVKVNGDEMQITVPRYREDIDGYPDIAEEIIRFYGYDNIKGTFLPSASITNGGFNDEQKAENKLKRTLVGKGMHEISTYSFYSQKDLDMLHFASDAAERKAIRILNPISEDLSIMRTTLAPSMVNVIVRNLRRGNMKGRLFELAKIYLPEQLPLKNFPEERQTLALGVWGGYGFFDLKGLCESVASSLNTSFEYEPYEKPFLHPGMTAKITCGGQYIGYLGVIAPTVASELALDKVVAVAEIDYEELKKHEKAFKYNPISKFAEITRDLALVCDSAVTCGEITKEIYSACKYVTCVKLFDVYVGAQVGENKKSMAFNVTFTPKDEPIEEKIDGFVKKILSNLKYKLNIDLR